MLLNSLLKTVLSKKNIENNCFKRKLLNVSVIYSLNGYLNNLVARRMWHVVSFDWFATHETSMSLTNSLITGDNKSVTTQYMEDLFEQKVQGYVYLIGKLLNASVDRSLNDYLNNLTTKRSKYKYNRQLLKFVDECGMLKVLIGLQHMKLQ
ncbi:Neutral ceramidase 1, partial [Mucuna pruriens]